MDGGAWWATVHGVTKSQTQLSDLLHLFHFIHVPVDIYLNREIDLERNVREIHFAKIDLFCCVMNKIYQAMKEHHEN